MGIDNYVFGKFEQDILAHFASFLSGYCLLISFCWVFGSWATQLLQSKKFVLQILLEALASFQVIVGASEGAGIGLKYGVQAWCLYTILRVVLQNYIFHGATADPVMVLLNTSTSAAEKCILISAQVLGGVLAIQCMPYLWQLSPSALHSYRLTTFNDECQCDLKVSVVLAFFIQLLYIFSICVVEYSVPRLGKVFTVTTFQIVVAVPGLPYTGMHINPLTAFVFNWSCSDTNLLYMVIVFILPPIAAAQMSKYFKLVPLISEEAPRQTKKKPRKSKKNKKNKKVE